MNTSAMLKLEKVLVLTLIGLGLFLLFSHVALAATPDQAPTEYKNLLDAFQKAAAHWIVPLRGMAQKLFWSLFLIELIWTYGKLALKGADFSEFVLTTVTLVLYFGFWWAIVLHGAEWMNLVIQSFQKAGQIATGGSGGTESISPSGVLATGLHVALKIVDSVSAWTILKDGMGSAIILFFSALVILLCYAGIAAYLAVALLESYLVIGASSIFFGFAGWRMTEDLAKKVLMYVIAVGAKVFVLQLIVGVGYQIITMWAAQFQHTNASLFGLIGLVVMFALVCFMIPGQVKALLSGVAGGGSPIRSVMGAAAMATGVGAAGVAGAKLAGAKLAGSAATGGSAGSTLAGASTKTPGGVPSAVSMMTGAGNSAAGPTASGPMSGRTAQASPAGTGSGSIQGGSSNAPVPSPTPPASAPAASSESSDEPVAASTAGNGSDGSSASESSEAAATPASPPPSPAPAASPGAPRTMAELGKRMAGGTGKAGAFVGLTAAYTAGHLAKHVGKANPGQAAADDMTAKVADLKKPKPRTMADLANSFGQPPRGNA